MHGNAISLKDLKTTDTWEKEGEGVLGPLYQHQEKKKSELNSSWDIFLCIRVAASRFYTERKTTAV